MNDTLFDLGPAPFSVGDLDEYIAELQRDGQREHANIISYFPSEWTRDGLAALLGKELPYRAYGRTELLALLNKARRAAS